MKGINIKQISFDFEGKDVIYDFSINQYRLETHFSTKELKILEELEKELLAIQFRIDEEED